MVAINMFQLAITGPASRCTDLRHALRMCVEMSGIPHKEICYRLDIENGHLSRMLSQSDDPQQTRHFPTEKINELMNVCGNEIPLQYLALSRGYGLLQTNWKLEREVVNLKKELADKDTALRVAIGMKG